MPLSENEIAQRIESGRLFCQRFSQNDRQASAKFRDPANSFPYMADESAYTDVDGGDVPVDVPVGEPNLITNNIIVKNASIAINFPDFQVKSKTENQAFQEVVRKFMKDSFRLKGWTRKSQEALQKYDVAGLGILAYRWDKDLHSTFEVVYTWQLSLDPNTIDFSNIKWAARKIRLSLRDAIAEYGSPRDDAGNQIFPDPGEEFDRLDTMKLDIWLYYDRESEVHQYGSSTIREDKNRYGAVPLLFLEAHPDPGPSIWPISSNVLASGLQNEYTEFTDIISNSAKHGSPITLADFGRMPSGSKEALQNKKQQALIEVDDIVDPPIKRIPAEQLSPLVLEVKQDMANNIDSIMGVTAAMRGQVAPDAKFATQVAAAQQSGGAMTNKARIEFERFLVRMAEVVIFMEREFGGPQLEDGKIETPDEIMVLWEAFQDVSEINVLECSTTYKDPTFELQQAMQRLNIVGQLLPVFAQLGGKLPNLEEYLNDVLRNSNIHDVARYWVEAPPPAPPKSDPPKISISLKGDLDPMTAHELAAGQPLSDNSPGGGMPQEPGALEMQPTGSGMQPPQIPS
jgi:hypothetical protein